ncbi:MAG TPA: IgGFc-binding protein [Minicystis sp.]|nr:IgGFc-binding protein [Minicystis sp.]
MSRASTSLFAAGGVALLVLGPVVGVAACSAGSNHGGGFGGSGGSSGTHHTGTLGNGGSTADFTTGPSMTTGTGDPVTCAQAAASHSYIGCDFWPTVVNNSVWSLFDFGVVVANASDQVVNVTVQRQGSNVQTAQVQPNSLTTLYLPWVTDLKGGDNQCGIPPGTGPSVMSVGGGYHLTTDHPVTVYQFNALEYAGMGGPPGKSWASCPGNACGLGCYSFSNDASLLLPTTAMTPNYRITGHQGQTSLGPYIAITGTADGTMVTVKLAATANVQAGGPIPAGSAGGSVQFSLNTGDVAELFGTDTSDFSGSLVTASKPVQVITGTPCTNEPAGQSACDHTEESVFPAETLGSHYFVVRPSGPNLNVVGQIVKIYGNIDGTSLTYPSGSQPPGAPTTINAGQVVDLGVVQQDFEIKGDHEFAISTFMLGASVVDPSTPIPNQKGDPSQSLPTAVEQYRTKYIFLAPTDYPVNFVSVVQPMNAAVMIDGVAGPMPAQIGTSGYGVARIELAAGNNGAHVLESNQPVGIDVMGYGSYTSYEYPGGLDLKLIAPPPPK